eukprot:SAG31_NODE_2235_length_6123_cov_2.723274_10_plen_89_part_00
MAHRDEFESRGFVLLQGAIEQPLLGDLQAAVQPLLAHHTCTRGAGGGAVRRHQTVLEPAWFHPAFIEVISVQLLSRFYLCNYSRNTGL